MKKLLILAAVAASLAACSSNRVPDAQPIATDLQDVPELSPVEILSMQTLARPKNGVAVVQTGAFQFEDPVYKNNGHTLLIPRRAILEGEYMNDGTTCTVTWQKLYPDIVEYKKNRTRLPVALVSSTTTQCDPTRGIKADDRMIVK